MIDEATLRSVLSDYLEPLYQLIGAGIAVLVIGSAVYFVLWPFLRNTKYYAKGRDRD